MPNRHCAQRPADPSYATPISARWQDGRRANNRRTMAVISALRIRRDAMLSHDRDMPRLGVMESLIPTYSHLQPRCLPELTRPSLRAALCSPGDCPSRLSSWSTIHRALTRVEGGIGRVLKPFRRLQLAQPLFGQPAACQGFQRRVKVEPSAAALFGQEVQTKWRRPPVGPPTTQQPEADLDRSGQSSWPPG